MDIVSAIQQRQSCRAFLDQSVSKTVISDILNTARYTPSGVNTQPWRVVVIQGERLQALGHAIVSAKEANIPENPDYAYYPQAWHSPYKERRKACGLALYSALNIDKSDVERRKEQWYKNYHFFGAPVGLLFFIEHALEKGSWVDMGMFIQTVMLAAKGFGLDTCPQAALADYPDIVREHCQLDKSFDLICGMALGYMDASDPVNQYRTEREPVSTFTTFLS